MADNVALLDAGALIPANAKLKKPETVDAVSARVFRHAALGDRAVVRLVSDKLAQGDDLAMDFLGFDPPEVDGPVGQQRRQALGFPGWALINDPKHARYALELVKEFKKAARRAKSKPGHAYDAFTDIAKRLNKSVAHFLPSFWEEVGREFILLGSTSYASRSFGKAREAERVHALKVDEELRKDAFLEFALAGCLTNKALTEYSKDLQNALDAKDAWAIYRELVVRRTLGGMPPWTSLPKEIPALIEAAGLDVEKESAAFFADILESRAMNRASMGFWKAASKVIAKLANENPATAGVLLNLIPETSGWDREDIWKWLDQLKAWGILSNAWNEDVPAEAGPSGGAAAWFSRLLALTHDLHQQMFDILRQLAPRLIKEGEPLNVVSNRRWYSASINLDIADLALELGVPVADPKADSVFDLEDWAETEDTVTDRHRDPVHVAKDKRFTQKLIDAVPKVAGDPDFEAAAEGKTALAEARKNWLEGEVTKAFDGALPGLEDALETVEEKTSRQTFAEFPTAYDTFRKVEPHKLLARTVRAGIIDEYGWPALETAADQLDPKGENDLSVYGTFPHVVVTDGLKALVVGQEGVIYEHELALTKKFRLEDMAYIDGQLAIFLKTSSYDNQFYWSGTPKKKFEEHHWGSEKVSGCAVDMPEGGTFNGHKTYFAGTQKVDINAADFAYDGQNFWRSEYTEDGGKFREVSPKEGKNGRVSMPSFFEEFLADGLKLVTFRCRLMKLDEAIVKDSPLGSRDGLVGCRVRQPKDDNMNKHREWQGIDGRSWTGNPGGDFVFTAMLDQPGTDQHLIVAEDDDSVSLWSPDGKFEVSRPKAYSSYNQGQVAFLPAYCWHAFRLRDVKVSKQLRKITDKQAKTLLAAMLEDLEAEGNKEFAKTTFTKTEAAVTKWLPALKNERLKRGLIGIAHEAALLSKFHAKLLKSRDPEGVDAAAVDNKLDAIIEPAFDALGLSTSYGGTRGITAHWADFAGFLASDEMPESISDPPFEWFEVLDKLHHNIWAAYWKTDPEKTEWLDFLEYWADLPFPDLPGRFRLVDGEFSSPPPFSSGDPDEDEDQWVIYQVGGSRFLLQCKWDDCWKGIEYAPDGKFKKLPKFKLDTDEECELELACSSEQIRAFVAAIRNNERVLPDLDMIREIADQVGVTVAELGLVWFGFPNLDSWEKNFLPKELREHLKLKVGEADAARQKLKGLPDEVRQKLLDTLLGEPELLWQDGGRPALQRVAKAWSKIMPKRLELPEKLVQQIDRDWRIDVNVGDFMSALAEPGKHPLFNANATWKLGDKSSIRLQSSAKTKVFDDVVMRVISICIPYMNHHLPVGDGGRSQMPLVHEVTLKCLKSKKLVLELGERYLWDEKVENPAQKLLARLFSKIEKRSKKVHAADDGLLAGTADEDEIQLVFRPSKIKGQKDLDRLTQMSRLLFAGSDADDRPSEGVDVLQRLLSKGLASICERIKKTPLTEGQFEANPFASVPKLVDEVAAHHKLSSEAAGLYLQLLTLADPTMANIKLWNDWTTAQFNKHVKELVGKELVLQAKRARAGRNFFLPGGWEALKAPNLPIETWKLSLYGIERDEHDRLQIPLGLILPTEPLHHLFAQAWERIKSGDVPKYEEVP